MKSQSHARICWFAMIFSGLLICGHFLFAPTAVAQSPGANYTKSKAGGPEAQTGVKFDVVSVEWLPLTDNAPLEDNPGNGKPNTAYGKRIFPEAVSIVPVDAHAEQRDKVLVRAKISVKQAGLKVHFKCFDVDDPSLDAPYDTTAGPDGDDNRFFVMNQMSSPDALTILAADGEAYATVQCRVLNVPGANFRVAAAASAFALKGLTVKHSDTGTNAGLVTGNDEQPALPDVKLTPLLTVWRRLHVEVDSMGTVAGNTITGQIVGRNPGQENNTSVVATDQVLEDDADRFENGRLKDSANKEFVVLASTIDPLVLTVRNQLDGSSPAVGAFTLVDDDKLKDGDDVPSPLLTVLVSKFRPAYIEVLLDKGGDPTSETTTAPFLLNLNNDSVEYLESIATLSRTVQSTNEFWTTHCIGAFQPPRPNDSDPNISPTTGYGGISSRKTAFSFYETINEGSGYTQEQQATLLVHEIGHNFGLPDEYTGAFNKAPYNEPGYNGIMQKVYQGEFTDENLAAIRVYGRPSK